jgi:error-prone DNA polymerase
MAQHRAQLNRSGVSPASRLASLSDSSFVRVAGAVIVRQRPGTAKGFVFLSLEDETGIANIIITPQHFEKDHSIVVHNSFLIVEGTLQNQDGVISVKARNIKPFHLSRMAVPAHDFH